MRQRNWTLAVLGTIGLIGFVLSRTVWGPPSKAGAADPSSLSVVADNESMYKSDAERRYLNNQPRHWRCMMLKRN